MLPSSDPTHPPTSRLARLGRLALKELREILRDRRTIVTLVLMPLLLYPLLSLVFQQFFLSQASQLTESVEYRIGFLNDDDLNFLLPYLQMGGLKNIQSSPSADLPASTPQTRPHSTSGELQKPAEPRILIYTTEDLERPVRELGLHVGLRLRSPPPPRGIDPSRDLQVECDLYYNTGSRTSRDAVAHIEDCLARANEKFLAARLKNLGISQPAHPVRSARQQLANWETAPPAVSLTAIVPFILILMTITGAVYPSIDLTAGERERGTLEMLVSAPIPRLSLLFAKYLAVLAVALLTAIVNLVMMFVTLAVTGLGGQLLGDAGLSADIMLSVLGLLLLFAAFFSAVLLALTSFARSFKEAQAYLIPLMLGSLAPAILGLMPGMKLSGLWLITPLVNIVLLGRDLLEMQATLAGLAVVVGSTILYSIAAIAAAARIFGAESVLYGRSLGWGDLFRPSTVTPQGPSLCPYGEMASCGVW